MRKKSGTNSEDIQDMNRALVIDLLRQMRPCSRAQLAVATGLQKATITNIVSDLMEWGLVRETGKLVGEKGRRAVGIELDTQRFKVLSIRLARRFFHVMPVDLLGGPGEKYTEEIQPEQTPEQILERIKKALWRFLNRQEEEGYQVLAIGMGAPGPILFRQGRIAYNITEFPGWERVSINEALGEEFHIPFYYDHDANTGALAEWTYGKYAREARSMVYIAAGDGIGGGIVMKGEIQHGAQGFFGEIGHTSINFNGERCGCGNRGCLDQYASGYHLTKGVLRDMHKFPTSLLHAVPKINVGSIIEAMRQGDEMATERIRRAAWYLGIGLVNMINCYDPDLVIIGDEMSTAGALLLDTVREVVRDHVLPEIRENIQIELTSLEEDPFLLGAAAVAINKVMAHPTALFPGTEK